MRSESEKRPVLVVFSLGAAAMLLGAVGGHEYDYYTLLRWVTTAAAVLIVIFAFQWQRIWAVAVFAFVTLLFNPLVPVALSKELWKPIDIGAAGLFLSAINSVRPQGHESLLRRLVWNLLERLTVPRFIMVILVILLLAYIGTMGYYGYEAWVAVTREQTSTAPSSPQRQPIPQRVPLRTPVRPPQR